MKKHLVENLIGIGAIALGLCFTATQIRSLVSQTPTAEPVMAPSVSERDIVIVWDPKHGDVQGSVVLSTDSFLPSTNTWSHSTCEMVFDKGKYLCVMIVPKGSYLKSWITYDAPNAYGGTCYAFDTSSDPVCGGKGSLIGTITMTEGETPVPFSYVWTGIGPSDPPTYFDVVVEIVP